MTICKLVEVSVRLEKAVNRLPPDNTPLEKYEQYEMVAIHILDSEHQTYNESELTIYLQNYLMGIDRRLKVTI
jgi:hypothetical protein